MAHIGNLKPTPLTARNPQRKLHKRTVEDPPELQLYIPPPLEAVQINLVTQEERKAKAEAERVARRAQRQPAPPIPKRTSYPPKKIGEILYDGRVPELYKGRHAVLMATGPSLTDDVVDCIREFHDDGTVVVFGCNDSYRICGYLDVHYACDPPWWDVHVWNYTIADHPAVKWTQDKAVPRKYGVNWIPGTSAQGLSTKPTLIHFGGNSGYQLINLALLYGVKDMALVGYNMGVPPGKQQHFFGSHPAPLGRSTSFASFAHAYETIQPAFKKRIVNCTPETQLKAFDQRALREVLSEWRSQDAMEAARPS